MSTQLDIPQDVIERVLVEIGFPIITLEDLGITEEQFLNLYFKPALLEYYKWFPILRPTMYFVENTFELDFPRPTTYGVTGANLNSGLAKPNMRSVYYLINTFQIMPANQPKYGSKYNYDISQANYFREQERQGVIEANKSFRVFCDVTERKLKGYTNVGGRLSVTWADWSDRWEFVHFQRQQEVINLAKANLLRGIGMLREQDSNDTPNALDGSVFTSRAQELEEDVLTGWQEFTKVTIMKN